MKSNSSARPTAVAVNGLLLLNKPQGLTSNQALQKVKRLLQAKKAGHTGSLDPAATGGSRPNQDTQAITAKVIAAPMFES